MSKKWLVILLTVIGILSVFALISPAFASNKSAPPSIESAAQHDISSSTVINAPAPANTIISDSRSGTNSIVAFTMTSTDYQMYLSLDQIPGESTTRGSDWIDVLSFNWGLSNATQKSSALGHQAGRVDLDDFSFTHLLDKASPRLMQSCVSAKNIKTGTLEVWKTYSPGHNRKVYSLKLSEILVSSVNLKGSSSVEQGTSTAKPLEDVVLNVAKVQWHYVTSYKSDDTEESSIDVLYDQRQSR